LFDPRLAPVRDVFRRYELHYYLSVRLPRLGAGLRKFWPAVNTPNAGETPTTIHGIRPKLDVVGQLIGAVVGRYKPLLFDPGRFITVEWRWQQVRDADPFPSVAASESRATWRPLPPER
jgi:hypothetical protein